MKTKLNFDDFNFGSIFYNNLFFATNYKIIVNQGGTYSGKTYAICLNLLIKAIENPNTRITVTGQTIPNLKRGALRDFINILNNDKYKIFNDFIDFYNKTDRIFYFKNGSFIEFTVFINEQDAKNGKRDYLFLNEANGLTYDVCQHLILKTEKNVFIDYNPTSAFWVHDKILIRKDTRLLISDHRANTHISQSIHDEIENNKNYEWWKVYARGLTGNLTGSVFPNLKVIKHNDWASEVSEIIWGLDYGYTNDPTAIVKAYIIDKSEVVLQEVLYLPSSDDAFIYDILTANGYLSEQIVYADHDKSINNMLRKRGVNVYNAIKTERSSAIQKLRGLTLWYTASSENLHTEKMRYVFKKSNDVITNIPDESGANHLMHALIYSIYTHFVVRNLFISK